MNSAALRPTTLKSCNCFSVRVIDFSPVSVAMIWSAMPWTLTSVVALPIASLIGKVKLAAPVSSMPSVTSFSKPAASTLMLYEPVGTEENEKYPSEFVAPFRTSPEAAFLRITVALATTAPDGS